MAAEFSVHSKFMRNMSAHLYKVTHIWDPEHGSCHGMYGRLQAFFSTKLSSAGSRPYGNLQTLHQHYTERNSQHIKIRYKHNLNIIFGGMSAFSKIFSVGGKPNSTSHYLFLGHPKPLVPVGSHLINFSIHPSFTYFWSLYLLPLSHIYSDPIINVKHKFKPPLIDLGGRGFESRFTGCRQIEPLIFVETSQRRSIWQWRWSGLENYGATVIVERVSMSFENGKWIESGGGLSTEPSVVHRTRSALRLRKWQDADTLSSVLVLYTKLS
jgi:hypothetical protein